MPLNNQATPLLDLEQDQQYRSPCQKQPRSLIAQSTGAVEYTDCTSAEGSDSPNGCSGHDSKQSDD